ncbi:hypothetical protein ACFQS1_05550 [Paractinoplanes rhizophilus]|uniref:Uncharacterized protein n=1 Tax=Paractinoplanes rhizophilus TaxID=1416877 RepID=A0ABW2HKM2_9ACTN
MPAEANGGPTGVAAYYVDASTSEAVRVGQDGSHEVLGNNLGGSPGIAVGSDGTVYVARSSDGNVYQMEAGQAAVEIAFSTDIPEALDLAVDDAGTLYVATEEDGVVKRLADGTESVLKSDDISQYSSIAVGQDGVVYVLDRVNGSVNRMDPSGTSSTQVAADPEVNEISYLSIDGQDRLYAGTATGTIYRITQGSARRRWMRSPRPSGPRPTSR